MKSTILLFSDEEVPTPQTCRLCVALCLPLVKMHEKTIWWWHPCTQNTTHPFHWF